MPEAYPARGQARRRWIESLRPDRNQLDPRRPYGLFEEQEPGPNGGVVAGTVVLLTNRECPWRCLMCDLWRNTLEQAGPPGSVLEQVRFALPLSDGTQIKLYNAGSFFDPRAIPEAERADIAGLLGRYDRVIVECHPSLVGDAVWRFRDQLPGGTQLEVALGLETADPDALQKLNKGMTVGDFEAAVAALRSHGVEARGFVLVRAPFQTEEQGARWALESVRVAVEAGCGLVALLPTRGGNGAMEALAAAGHYAPPSLATLEDVFDAAMAEPARIVVDLWDLPAIRELGPRVIERRERLDAMNLQQTVLLRIAP